ncbi:MAG: hypothetical protein Q7S76_04410, partial [bacterium]|nr:hypothetical protein [bacterium]
MNTNGVEFERWNPKKRLKIPEKLQPISVPVASGICQEMITPKLETAGLLEDDSQLTDPGLDLLFRAIFDGVDAALAIAVDHSTETQTYLEVALTNALVHAHANNTLAVNNGRVIISFDRVADAPAHQQTPLMRQISAALDPENAQSPKEAAPVVILNGPFHFGEPDVSIIVGGSPPGL